MKRFCLASVMALFCLCVQSQSIVSDPSAMAQRITLFLEQMEESVSQGMELSEETANTAGLLSITKESFESLKKISEYIKSSNKIVEIADAQVRIINKSKEYVARIEQLPSLSYNERLNTISSIVSLTASAEERIVNAMEVAKESKSDAKLSDYERLQILDDIYNEVLAIEDAIDEAYEESTSTSSTNGLISSFSKFFCKTATYNF